MSPTGPHSPPMPSAPAMVHRRGGLVKLERNDQRKTRAADYLRRSRPQASLMAASGPDLMAVGLACLAIVARHCYDVGMSAGLPGSGYLLEIKAMPTAGLEGWRYEIWEKLDLPWLIRSSGRYSKEAEAKEAGQAALRSLVGETTA